MHRAVLTHQDLTTQGKLKSPARAIGCLLECFTVVIKVLSLYFKALVPLMLNETTAVQ
jgi:hypothetical protein